jgi:hypothetical protein
MMRWFGIASLIGIAAVWIAFGMSLWLVVGPWRLGRALACRLGLHGRMVSQVNPDNRNTEGRCVACHRFMRLTQIPC